jgi:putative FmdB family regulatory protein
MPIYEYQCQSCGKSLEVLQKISDEPLLDCPECGEAALKKKVSAAAFRLKGGGWYETDFKTGNKKNLAGSDAGSGSSAGAGTDKPASGGSKGGDSSGTAGSS